MFACHSYTGLKRRRPFILLLLCDIYNMNNTEGREDIIDIVWFKRIRVANMIFL
jgi:hypothetical protein